MKENKLNFIECPKCLGEGEYYSPLDDDVIVCSLCKGLKSISQKLAETYDPIADELTDLMIDDEK